MERTGWPRIGNGQSGREGLGTRDGADGMAWELEDGRAWERGQTERTGWPGIGNGRSGQEGQGTGTEGLDEMAWNRGWTEQMEWPGNGGLTGRPGIGD